MRSSLCLFVFSIAAALAATLPSDLYYNVQDVTRTADSLISSATISPRNLTDSSTGSSPSTVTAGPCVAEETPKQDIVTRTAAVQTATAPCPTLLVISTSGNSSMTSTVGATGASQTAAAFTGAAALHGSNANALGLVVAAVFLLIR